MYRFSLLLVSLLLVKIAGASDIDKSQRKLYDEISQSLVTQSKLPNLDQFSECYDKTISCQTGRELFVQALDELLRDGVIEEQYAKTIIKNELKKNISLFDKIHIITTFEDFELDLSSRDLLAHESPDRRTQAYLDSHEEGKSRDWNDRYGIAKALLKTDPPIKDYWDGRYYLKPRIYMFCRDNRKQPCLMLMKDAFGRISRLRNKDPWTQVSLGFSRHKKDFYQTNGNTPSGVFRVDGVMPEADKQIVFGKHRRLILNFVGYSENEINYKKLLPAMTHKHKWWREAVTARDNGRGLFRVHGTGLRSNSRKPYFPLVPTAGCVAKRENQYGDIDYKDQRLLLDQIMRSSGFEPIYQNETRILGLLYVIDIDKKNEPVTLASLKEAGIL